MLTAVIVIILTWIMLFFAVAGAYGLHRDYPDNAVCEIVASIVLLAALSIGTTTTLHFVSSTIDGRSLLMVTKEEFQVIKQFRTTKKIQQLKRELHELKSRSTEAVL